MDITEKIIKQLVLIVDDVPRNLQYIGTLLRKNGIDFALARVKTQLELKTYRDHLEELVKQRTAELENARLVTILGLAKLTEYREKHTGWHLERIREYTRLLSREMAKKEEFAEVITPEFIQSIYNSSILHDIGKVALPDALLLKPGKLTEDEYEIIKIHTFLGGNLIQKIESRLKGESFLIMAREIAHFHHEKWDGSGYPEGLAGEQIPVAARITALADVYDALISRRPYKDPFLHEKARRIIIKSRGSHFDPRVVDAFLACEPEFIRIMTELRIEGDPDLNF